MVLLQGYENILRKYHMLVSFLNGNSCLYIYGWCSLNREEIFKSCNYYGLGLQVGQVRGVDVRNNLQHTLHYAASSYNLETPPPPPPPGAYISEPSHDCWSDLTRHVPSRQERPHPQGSCCTKYIVSMPDTSNLLLQAGVVGLFGDFTGNLLMLELLLTTVNKSAAASLHISYWLGIMWLVGILLLCRSQDRGLELYFCARIRLHYRLGIRVYFYPRTRGILLHWARNQGQGQNYVRVYFYILSLPGANPSMLKLQGILLHYRLGLELRVYFYIASTQAL